MPLVKSVLEHASVEMQKDKEVVIAAVKSFGGALDMQTSHLKVIRLYSLQ